MAEHYQYINNGSIIIPDTENLLAEVQAEWRGIFGDALNLDPSTPQGRIIEMIAANRKQMLEFCSLIANQINPYYATGQGLDALGALFGIKRRSGEPTSVYCEVTGTPNTVIPIGSEAKTTIGNIFVTRQRIVIGSNGTGYGTFYSKEDDAIPCEIGTLTEIVTQRVGWNSIRNNIAAIIGSPLENDMDFRQRIIVSRYRGVALLESVESALYNVKDVIDFVFYNNGSDNAYLWDGVVTVPPHSICVIIQGGADKDIAEALFRTVTIGCGYTSIDGLSTVYEVLYKGGSSEITYPITFNRPTNTPISCKIRIKKNDYTGVDIEKDVKTAISSWANNEIKDTEGLTIGATVYTYEIGAALSQQIPEIIVQDVKIGTIQDGIETVYANEAIDFNITQLPTLAEENIIVESF